ncbi:hypothetical protein DLAC_03562 [Tieghemostelium lacteum]|uniref:Cytochrome c oxidase assembly protein COX19 n=1 Tax=Tieghemostelium lacteum TaxID=361077 RepID=A0A152A135_TIELA|nr:hypothetical protein DLAC_03562 [Tieghemostelium lacteum]|eukprot:KYQ99972.1 hypothetical protein DLAC_03562 [Tieghemostelium lacteum]
MNFAHNSSIKAPTPPDKGSFPLDHDKECNDAMGDYLKCLQQNNSQSRYCVEFTKAYLKCRMDNGLMAKEEMENFGFDEIKKATIVDAPKINPNEPIIAGLRKRGTNN